MRHIIYLFLFVATIFAVSKVDGVVIHGNENIANWQIEKLVRTQKTSWFKRFMRKEQFFSSKRLENDLAIIKDYYSTKGYIEVEVKATATPRVTEPNKLLINIFITEGPRYKLDSVVFTGESPPEIPFEVLSGIIIMASGDYLNPLQVRLDGKRIQAYLQSRGYPYARALGDYSKTGDGTAVAKIDVAPGKKAYFGGVTYVGLDNTRASAVRRELEFEFGDLFNTANVTATREALYRTGLFSIASVEPVNIEEQPETLDFRITVAEKPPRWIITRMGAGSDENYPIFTEGALGWGHRNLFGTGRRFSIEASSKWELVIESSDKWWPRTAVYNLTNRFDVKYREPWIFGSRTPITLNLYFEPLNREEIEQYKLQTIGFEISAEHSIGDDWVHNVFFNYERADIFDIENEELQEEILERRDKPISRRLGYTAMRDKRDNVLVPTTGSYFVSQLEIGGYFLGGDENYTKFSLLNQRYYSFRGKYILALRGRLSVIGNWKAGEDDILEHRKYFLGGANTIRGWEERSIGPTYSDGQPKGGKAVILGNAELRTPLFWNFWGHVFFDIGNLWPNAEAFNPDDLRGSAGWGIAFITPVGPIRFDYGYQIINKDESVDGNEVSHSNWHLSLMYAF